MNEALNTAPQDADAQADRIVNRKRGYALLVDGYVKDLFTTGMILQRLDYDVYIVNSGEDAIKLIDQSVPDIIITELSLPNMSGLELLVHLKRKSSTKAIPIIVHTAASDQGRENHCRALGCAAYLKKPTDVNSLYIAIQYATEKTPRQFIRVRTLLPVRVGGQTSNDAAASIEFVTELSENGVFVCTLNPRPVNTAVQVSLIIQSMAVKVTAVVVRSLNMDTGLFREPGMGLKFTEISAANRELLRNFIKGRIMKDITLQ